MLVSVMLVSETWDFTSRLVAGCRANALSHCPHYLLKQEGKGWVARWEGRKGSGRREQKTAD